LVARLVDQENWAVTEANKEIAELILLDSGKEWEEEAERANKENILNMKSEPLYDVEQTREDFILSY
jgi:hypothetical protein